MTLYTASRRRALLTQQLSWLAARAGAGRLFPGERVAWDAPVDEDVLDELLAQWQAAAGHRVSALAIYNRPQEYRPAVTLMICAGRHSLLVRLRSNADSLLLEERISASAANSRDIDAFQVPAVRGEGTVGAWSWVGYEVISRRPHGPAYAESPALFEQVTTLVEAVVPRPAGVSRTWRGAHGDLTPWNLRRARGRDWLIDWEDVRYAPPGADRVYLELCRAAIGARRADLRHLADPGYDEARSFWSEELASRPNDRRDNELIARMLDLL